MHKLVEAKSADGILIEGVRYGRLLDTEVKVQLLIKRLKFFLHLNTGRKTNNPRQRSSNLWITVVVLTIVARHCCLF